MPTLKVSLVRAHCSSQIVRFRKEGEQLDRDEWLKRGHFTDMIDGSRYSLSVRELSDIGARLRDGETYVIVYTMPFGEVMNETHLRAMLPYRDRLSTGSNEADSLVGLQLSQLVAKWGDPDELQSRRELLDVADEAMPQLIVAAAVYRSRKQVVLLGSSAEVLKVETMP